MYAALVTIAALVGVAIGSFLNVVIYRVPRGESVVRPGSHCPTCGRRIRPSRNVPIVSYVLLRGRCASCGARISLRYPVIEAATGVLFAATTAWALASGNGPLLPALLYLAAVGLALAAIDLELHRLPNALVLPSYPVVAILLTAAASGTGDWWALGRAGIGAVALFAFYLLLVLAYPAGMGWGDVKLAGVLGAVLGYVGWPALIVGAFAGFVFGAVVAIAVIVTRRGTGKSALPFGPFMLMGAAAGIVFGADLAAAYWEALGA